MFNVCSTLWFCCEARYFRKTVHVLWALLVILMQMVVISTNLYNYIDTTDLLVPFALLPLL